jgi:type VI secretion system protein ImpA
MQTIRCSQPSLELDPRFAELESVWSAYDAYLEDPESGEPPIIDAVGCRQLGLSLLEDTPDLRLALWNLRAGLRIEGLVSLADSIHRIDQLLTEHGERTHPLSDDETAGSGHALALAWLAGGRCARELVTTPLHPATAICLADVDKGGLRADTCPVAGAWEDVLDAIDRIQENINARATDFAWHPDALCETIRRARRLFSPARHGATESAAPLPRSGSTGAVDATGVPPSSGHRRDAFANVEAAITYFVENEPGHPAPILLRRVLRMADMDFHELVAELIPEANESLARISGAYHHEAT